ncbi:MAG: hypothetical protein LBV51_02015 [Acholeplasmatales bacterium]|jgi:hypothetical protein|nr:hypothetical protein [Acholeplasmatales bacterium]
METKNTIDNMIKEKGFVTLRYYFSGSPSAVNYYGGECYSLEQLKKDITEYDTASRSFEEQAKQYNNYYSSNIYIIELPELSEEELLAFSNEEVDYFSPKKATTKNEGQSR